MVLGALPECNQFSRSVKDGKTVSIRDLEHSYRCEDGEELVMEKGPGSTRQPLIRLKDGSLIAFEEWKPVKLRRNREKLDTIHSSPELRAVLSKAYEWALKQCPELWNVELQCLGSAQNQVLEKTGGFARHPERNNGKATLIMNTEDGLKHFETLMQARKLSVEISAQKMGLSPEEMTPEMLAAFIFLHELGHTKDYLTRYTSHHDFQQARKQEMQSLPVLGANPSVLNTQLLYGGPLSDWYDANRAQLRQDGYGDRASLHRAQEKAYREIDTEAYADNFAVQVIRAN